MRRLLNWLRDHRRDEKSNSFVVFIILAPLIIGVFGLGVDVARNVYVRSALQNDLDLAVYGGLNDVHTEMRRGEPTAVLNSPDRVLSSVERVYNLNREQGPALSCTGTGTVAGSGDSKCWSQPRTPVVTDTTICYWVSERSRNAFLPVLSSSLAYQTFNIASGGTIDRNVAVACN